MIRICLAHRDLYIHQFSDLYLALLLQTGDDKFRFVWEPQAKKFRISVSQKICSKVEKRGFMGPGKLFKLSFSCTYHMPTTSLYTRSIRSHSVAVFWWRGEKSVRNISGDPLPWVLWSLFIVEIWNKTSHNSIKTKKLRNRIVRLQTTCTSLTLAMFYVNLIKL
jgi:hypothetical protein